MSVDRPLTLMSVGDLFVTRDDPLSIYGDTTDLLSEADFLFGNQEGPISDRGDPRPGVAEAGMTCLRAPLRSVEPLVSLGFSGVTLANNHGMDYGEAALVQTIEVLHDHGIATVGLGINDGEARAPAFFSKEGTRVGMLGYTTVFPVGAMATANSAGLAAIRVATSYLTPPAIPHQPGTPSITVTIPDAGDFRRMEDEIKSARASADLLVVQFHWGVAGHAYALGYMKELAHAAIDAGADLIVGNHPHVLLGVEVYRDVPIYYNLNHFAFELASPRRRGALDTMVLRSEIRGGRFTRHTLVPATIDQSSRDLSLATGAERVAARDLLLELSSEYGTCIEDKDDCLAISGPRPGTPPPLRAPAVLFDSAPFVYDGWKASKALHAHGA
jgi:poly-gamma-glutamate capsule biosynthesis protein CapA/YwtB (metallophosphatase superfamily)